MTTIVAVELGGTGANNTADARAVLGVASSSVSNAAYSQANSAYAQANLAYTQANTATTNAGNAHGQANSAYGAANTAQTTAQNAYAQANNSYGQANSAYGQANTATTNAGNAFNQANTATTNAGNAYGQANSAFNAANTAQTTAQNAYGQANTATTIAGNAYAQANTAYNAANTAQTTAQNAYGQANLAYTQANSAYSQSNNAYTQANNSYGQANLAYDAANTKFSITGGSITGNVTINGNLTVQGNATTINVSNLSVNDSIILLATNQVGDSNDIGFVGHFDRGATATHAGIIRKASQNQFYLFDNYEAEPTNNVIDVSGNNFRVGNLRLGIINADSFVTTSGLNVTNQANNAYAQANLAYTQANNAYGQANLAYTQANNAYGQANLGYTQANSAYSQANSAYTQANTATTNAGTAQTTAQNAYGAANTAQTTAQNAYGQANTATTNAGTAQTTAQNAYGAANTAQTTAQNAYGQANTATTNASTAQTTAQNAYGQANTAYTQANNAYGQANSAFTAANNRVATVSGTSGRITSSGTTAITLDLATAGAGAASYSSGISAVTVDAYGRVTSVTGSASYATTTQVGNAYNQANTATTNAGTAQTTAQNAYGQANTATTNASTAQTTAQNAYGQANTATTNAGTAQTTAQNAYGQANTATTNAGNAYNQANTATTIAQNAYGQANTATSSAASKVASVSGTSGRITSSGGTTPTIDLATAGAGAATYSSGISALTIDAYGRVTSVTGSAGYATTSSLSSYLPLAGGTMTGQLNIGTATNLAFGSATRQMIDLWSTSYGIGVQSSTQYYRTGGRFSWFRGGIHSNTENDAGSGGTVAMTLDSSSILSVTGDVRAPIFYDSNDTNYFIDPASTSRVNVLQFSSGATAGPYFYYGNNQKNLYFRSNADSDVGMSFFDSAGNWRAQIYAASGNYGFLNGNWSSWDIRKVPSGSLFLNNQSTYYIDGSEIYYNRVYGVTDIRSPIFYDNNNTGFYIDPASTSNINQLNGNGKVIFETGDTYLRINQSSSFTAGIWYGTSNRLSGTSYIAAGSNGSTTSSRVYIYGGTYDGTNVIYLDGSTGIGRATGDWRAPIFYDSDNTGYYLNPNSTSQLHYVLADNWFRPQGNTGLYFETYGTGLWSPTSAGNAYGNVSTYGSGRNGWSGWGIGSRHVFMSTGGDNVGVHDNSRGWIWYWDGAYTRFDYGYTQFANSARAPIFYDSDDTNVYFDGGALILRSSTPTVYFRDTDNNSAMLHCNSNVLYVLRGGNDTTSWTQVNSQWPFIFNLSNNDASCGGSFGAVGNITAYASDRRLKTNIKNISNALDKVLSLNGVTFDWIDRVKELGFTPDTMINDAGIIAQEVQEVLPQAVKLAPFDYQWDEDKNDYASRSGEDFITVQYEKLVPLLIEAIKELKAEIELLKNRG